MITVAGRTYAPDDPAVLGAIAALVLVVLLLAVFRAALRAARSTAPLAHQMGWMAQRVQALSDGQERLAGGLSHVSDAQAQSQAAMLRLM